jgi:SAM-dependent methyltransferase
MVDSGPGLNSETMLNGIELQCPRCRSEIACRECLHCGFQMRELSGILYALPPERAVHHARLVEEYERIQRTQILESRSDEFFLGLPYSDALRRNASYWVRKASSFDCFVRRVLKVMVPSGGRILDLGAGNCWLSYRLVLAGYKPCAIDLLTNNLDGLGTAERYRRYLPDFFPRFRAEFDYLPFKDGQFDAAIFNASFHFAESFENVLREALRCCKPGGIVIICDTPWFSSKEFTHGAAGVRASECPRPVENTSGFTSAFLTDTVLASLAKELHISWMTHYPHFGLRSTVEPFLARLYRRPPPPQFPIWVAQSS